MELMKKILFLVFLISILTACNSVKHVAENEHLLAENIIFVDSVKSNTGELQKYILQKPNSRFLGIPFGLHIHNLGNHSKPKTPTEWGKKFPNTYTFIRSVFSEKQSIAYAKAFINLNNWYLSFDKPQLVDDIKVKRSAENLSAYFKTQGYFQSKVNARIQRDSIQKKAVVSYTVHKGKPTILDEISLDIKSEVLDSIYKSSGMTSLLKTGSQYRDETFRKEAKNVVKLFRNNGIYHFSESALGFYVDSTRSDFKTDVDFIISSNRLFEKDGEYIEKPFKVHSVKKVNVYTDYTFNRREEAVKDSVSYGGINFYAYDKVKYNPKYLSQAIFLKPNSIYKDTLRVLTRSHIKSLKNFKSTNIKFSPYQNKDDELEMDVFLTPTEKYTLGFETELTHSNIRNVGTSGKFSITNRNTFKGSELFKLSFLGSWFNSTVGPGWEVGTDVSIEIPRFVAPFGLSNFVPKEMSPRTLVSLGSSFQKNIGLDRQTFTFMTDFKWNYNSRKTIQLEIFNTQYVKNINVGRYFDIYRSEFNALNEVGKVYNNNPNFSLPTDDTKFDSTLQFMNTVFGDSNFAATNPSEYTTNVNILNRFNIITSDFLIPILAYSYTYNNQSNFRDTNFSFFKIRVANSGNIMGLLSNNRNANNKRTFLNIPLAQYFKTDIEYKKFWDIGKSSVLGFRSFLGAIFTYDNSDIPFIKSYFAGGSNDIRAWQTYELGPGSRATGLEFNVGSLKFLTSAEYRFDIFSKLKGALFVDAGNIWDITGSSLVDEASRFKGLGSLSEIAIGSGFGARVDFSFLVVRLDVGFKTYEPYLSSNKWFSNYNFSNAVYNIGINYPF